ncbi:MAG: hypothetical protein ACREFR_19745, partial [Limisphaerales bacterium]
MNWEKLKTILWLRWRLTCNQSRRNFGAGLVVSILFGAAAAFFALGSFAAGLLAGGFALAGASAMDLWFTWFGITAGFLFIWTLGLVMELQRSETIDLQKLMHLPVALGPMFVINFLASNFTLSVIIIAPAMAGLAIGLAFSRGLEMALLLPLAAATVFMISAWTYCFRGWIAQLMTNPRRRRTVLMCLTFSFILLAQGPNLYFRLHPPGQHGGGRN